MTAAQRELDIVLYGATGFVGKLTAEYLARSRRGGPHRARGPLRRTPARGARITRRCGAGLAADRRRRRVAVFAERHGGQDPGGRHHRRPLHEVRLAAGRRVRGRGHRLRRPHRRDDVHPREHRHLPRAGRRHRRADRALMRIRLHPFGSHRLRVVRPGPHGRRGPTRRDELRDARHGGRRIRRHHRLDDRSHVGDVGRPRGTTADERSLHPDHRPRGRTRARTPVRHPVAARVATSPPNSAACGRAHS